MTTKEVFAAAADLLGREGWGQGSYKKEDGTRCMLGACMAVTVGDRFENAHDANWQPKSVCEDYSVAVQALEDHFYALGKTTGKRASAAEWNDAPGRTKDEVIAKLRELAS